MDAAVRDFQTANGLEITGGLDEATLSAASPMKTRLPGRRICKPLPDATPAEALKSGNVSDAVRDMQSALRELGYYEGEADGVFGDGTRRAVMAFQTANGLAATGEGRPRHAAASARGADPDLAGLHRRKALPARRFRRGRALFAAAAQADGLL